MDAQAIRLLLTRLGSLERTAVRFRLGVVTADSPLSVALGGSTVPCVGVRSLANVAVGDTVAVLTFGNDLLVLGRTGPDDWHYVGGANALGTTFLNSWVNYDVDRPVRFYKAGGRCYLEGIAKSGAVGTILFTLPVGYRPTIGSSLPGASVSFPIVSNGAFGLIYVSPAGEVSLGVGSSALVDLSPISFRCA